MAKSGKWNPEKRFSNIYHQSCYARNTSGTRLPLAHWVLLTVIFQLYYGEEQDFYLYDNGASNYLYGLVVS